jgi:hypothetical protein
VAIDGGKEKRELLGPAENERQALAQLVGSQPVIEFIVQPFGPEAQSAATRLRTPDAVKYRQGPTSNSQLAVSYEP